MANTAVKIPTPEEIEQAKKTSRELSKFTGDQIRIKATGSNGTSDDMVLPGYAFQLLLDILTQMSMGNAVTFMPVNAELTTQQAANLLNVSRPFLVGLLDSEQIPCRMVGSHRRILAKDVIAYKSREEEARLKVLEELSAQAQALDMGYE
jgi:excisionase family DNA binding protein